MDIISIIIVLVIIGVVLWAVNAYVPMAAAIKKILNIAVVILTVIWLVRISGLMPDFPHMHNLHW